MIFFEKKPCWIKQLPILLFFYFLSVTCLPAEEMQPPFRPGEKFTFRITWSGLLIGHAVLEVLPMAQIEGRPANHFVLSGRTEGIVDFFYRVHTRIDAFADTALTHSVFFKNQISGRHNKLITFHFDWEKSQVRRTENGQTIEPVTILPGTFDLLSVFYFSRINPMWVNAVYDRPVTDGKKNVMGRMTIVKRENIKASGKIYDAFLLEPETKHIGGVFKKSRNPKIQLWVTADKRRMPVRARSEVIVGSFVGELIAAEGL
ncbi:MAG: DUF3108 domain-containing protein [Desulfobacteraceae bacterium]|nr:MAG: DUF3108 domain-containing protein [Desulfobacteraceae bacterium]